MIARRTVNAGSDDAIRASVDRMLDSCVLVHALCCAVAC